MRKHTEAISKCSEERFLRFQPTQANHGCIREPFGTQTGTAPEVAERYLIWIEALKVDSFTSVRTACRLGAATSHASAPKKQTTMPRPQIRCIPDACPYITSVALAGLMRR